MLYIMIKDANTQDFLSEIRLEKNIPYFGVLMIMHLYDERDLQALLMCLRWLYDLPIHRI